MVMRVSLGRPLWILEGSGEVDRIWILKMWSPSSALSLTMLTIVQFDTPSLLPLVKTTCRNEPEMLKSSPSTAHKIEIECTVSHTEHVWDPVIIFVHCITHTCCAIVCSQNDKDVSLQPTSRESLEVNTHLYLSITLAHFIR